MPPGPCSLRPLRPVFAPNPALGVKREGRSYRFYGLIDDIVYDSVFLSLLRVHDEIALHIFLHFVELLPGVLGEQLVCYLAHAQNLPSMNVDVGSLTGQASHGRWVNQDAGVRQG